jgi:hypothetical protein
MRLSLLLALALTTTVACKKDRPLDGIGPYRFGKTTLGDWGYACNPPDAKGHIYCQSNPLERTHAFKIGERNGEQNALIAATFYSADKTAPLAELELYVDECKVDSLKAWLRSTFGSPTSTSDQKMFWKQRKLFIAAKVPPTATECYITMVEASNSARIDELMNGPAAPAAPAPAAPAPAATP